MIERSYSKTYVTNYSIPRSASTYVVAAPVTLARSSTTVFTHNPRSYHPLSSYTPTITPRIGVVGSTPHYKDRYPYVQYSSYSPGPYAAHGILTQTANTSYGHYSTRNAPMRRYVDSHLNAYQSSLRTTPSYGSSVYSSSSSSYAPRRWASPRMDVDDAVNMYKKSYLTGGMLSKYWLTPRYWENRREKEKKVSSAISNYGYSSAYTNRYF